MRFFFPPRERWTKTARNLISNFLVMTMNTDYSDTLWLPQRNRPQLKRWWNGFILFWWWVPKSMYLTKFTERVILGICVLSHIQLFAASWTAAHLAPLIPEFSRQEYHSGLPFPPPGDLPHPEIHKLYFTNPDLPLSLSLSLSLTHTHTHTHTHSLRIIILQI